jgi:small conductance mechanosensitive channel
MFLQDVLAEHGPRILSAALALAVGWWLVRFLSRALQGLLARRRVDSGLSVFLVTACRSLLGALVLITALDILGVPTTSLFIVAGAVAIAAGMALHGPLANLAAGAILTVFKPVRIGDLVEVVGNLGVVEDVQLFSTVLVSLDNREIVVPNAIVTSGHVVNYSGRKTRRVDLVFGIGYGDDIRSAKEVMTRVLSRNRFVLSEPAPTVAVSELADSSVNFVVRPWCKTSDYWDAWFSLTEEIKLGLESAGISIPFTQRETHMHDMVAT